MLPNLKLLLLHRALVLTRGGLNQIVEKMPNVERVKLWNCHNVSLGALDDTEWSSIAPSDDELEAKPVFNHPILGLTYQKKRL